MTYPHIETKADYAKYEAAFARGTAGYEIVTTACHEHEGEDCDCHAERGSEWGFSWSLCEICNRALGGTRYEMAMTNPGEGPIYYVLGCTDCLYYATYGHLDDTTMMEME